MLFQWSYAMASNNNNVEVVSLERERKLEGDQV
jgi:hypothetical protein